MMTTKRKNWESFRFDFRFRRLSYIVIILLCWSCFSSEAYENESPDPARSNSKMEWMELRLKQLENAFLERKNKEQVSAELEAGRLDKIEKELQAQKDKFSALEVKQESQFNEISTQFNSIKRSLFDNKHQHKRQADQINKNSKKVCSDSSRLCTYYFPDHPDAKAVEKKSQHKRQADEYNKNSKNVCSDSSRLCTYYHPDHPDTKAVDKSSNTSINKTIQMVANSDGKKGNSYPKAVDKSSGSSSTKTIQSVADSDDKKVTGPPTSCKDLNQIGHSLNGYYLVKKTYEKKNKMQTIYCNFNQLKVLENMIGNVEVKTKDVHFYVQRKSSFKKWKNHKAIPFEIEKLNVGKAMNLHTGVFTAPVPGIYYFAFSTVKDESPDHLIISIRLNGKEQGRAYSELFNQNTSLSINTKATLSLTASLYLKEKDRVNLFIEYNSGVLYDTKVGQHTHFTGWLVNEELV